MVLEYPCCHDSDTLPCRMAGLRNECNIQSAYCHKSMPGFIYVEALRAAHAKTAVMVSDLPCNVRREAG